MAGSHVKDSSDKIVNTVSDCLDFNKLKEYITSESIVYDGIRMKWCCNYDSLKVFIESVCSQHGKWRPSGGNAKRFDSSTSDFVTIWYPGKLNTLTFNGEVGKQTKERLIKLCTSFPMGNFENIEEHKRGCIDLNQDNLNLEIEILKSRVDSMQSLMNSQGSGMVPKICEMSNEIALLKIDLEEEKFRNTCLEREVKRLQQEVELINSYRNGSACTTNNTELINIPPTQDSIVIEDNRQSTPKVLNTNDQIRTQQNNEELAVIEDVHQLSSNHVFVSQMSVTEEIDKQLQDYRSNQSHKSTQQNNKEDTVVIEEENRLSANHITTEHLSVTGKIDKQLQDYRSEQNYVFKHQHQVRQDSIKHQVSQDSLSKTFSQMQQPCVESTSMGPITNSTESSNVNMQDQNQKQRIPTRITFRALPRKRNKTRKQREVSQKTEQAHRKQVFRPRPMYHHQTDWLRHLQLVRIIMNS